MNYVKGKIENMEQLPWNLGVYIYVCIGSIVRCDVIKTIIKDGQNYGER